MAFNDYAEIRTFGSLCLKRSSVYRNADNLIIEEVALVSYDCSSLLKLIPLHLLQGRYYCTAVSM
jgi:hypothetical protein